MANKISVIIDVAVDKANAGLKSFKSSIDDADGAANKFKAGTGAAFDSIKNNAGNLALAGGAALVTFGVKAVSAFQDTAIEAGKMADALGLPVEDMSRLIEVAGDLGVEASSLESRLGKMNVTAGKTPGEFDKIGAAIVRNKDGSMDVNATFLATIEALNKIPDAGAKAAAAQKIFGKGWKDIAELVEQGSDRITKSLAEVSDAKIINDGEVEKAREYRAAMDNLGDALEDVMLVAGEGLVPALTELADTLVEVKGAAETVGDIIPSQVTTAFGLLTDQVQRSLMPWKYVTDFMGDNDEAARKVSSTWGGLADDIGHVSDELAPVADLSDDYTTATEAVNDAIQESLNLHREEAEALDKVREARRLGTDAIYAAEAAEDAWWEQVKQTTEALEDAEIGEREKAAATRDLATATDEAVTAQLIANGVNVDSEAGQRAWLDAMLASAAGLSGPMRDEVLRYIGLVTGIPAEQLTLIKPDVDFQRLEEIERALNFATRARDVRISTSGSVPRYASGTSNHPGGLAIVGEKGPELVELPRGSAVHTASATAGMTGSASAAAGGITFNIYDASDPQRVVDAIRQFVRRNGPIQGIT